MTVQKLLDQWQFYAIDVDVEIRGVSGLRRIKKLMVLKERFFVCFLSKDSDGEHCSFDPGGHDPKIIRLKPGEDNDCYIKLPSGKWVKIGKFVRLKN